MTEHELKTLSGSDASNTSGTSKENGVRSVDEGYDSGGSEDRQTDRSAPGQPGGASHLSPSCPPEPEVFILARGLSDYRYTPYSRRPSSSCAASGPSAKHGDAASPSRPPPLVWIRRSGASSNLSRVEAELKWASGNELRISKTLLPEDTHFEESGSQVKLQLFVQLDPRVKELKSFMADVKSETDNLVTQKFLGPIVIFLKEELAESQEAKVLALVTAEERAAAHNLVQEKELAQLTEGVGPHQDTVLAILCAQKQPHQPGRTLAQVLAPVIMLNVDK